GVETLTGSRGWDRFTFEFGGQIDGVIDGGEGVNTLDYTLHAGNGVTVDLLAGTATSVVGGVSRIQNVIGSAAGDVLTGNGEDNLLIGNGGTDTLAGPSGSDGLVRRD